MDRNKLLEIAKPILFNTDMVRAILEDRKTATRRIAKNITPFNDKGECFNIFRKGEWIGPVPKFSVVRLHAPYKVGDYLYVRETWCELSFGYVYKADGKEIDHLGNVIRWHPSIHMPKEAARIFLKVTDVRLERLNDIDDIGIKAEGITPHNVGMPDTPTTLLSRYVALWNTTVPKKELHRYCWEANTWVWAIEFERVKVQ